MKFSRFSLLAILAAVCPVAFYTADPAGGGNPPPPADPAQPPALTQADVDKAVAAEKAKWAEQFKSATGLDNLDAFREHQAKQKGEEAKLIDALKAEKAALEQRYQGSLVESQLRAASGAAVDPDVIVAMLCGKAEVKDGVVTVNGKIPADAVAEFLKARPHLAKPAGPAGGGTPQNGGGHASKTLTRWEFASLGPIDRMKFVKDGGTIA